MLPHQIRIWTNASIIRGFLDNLVGYWNKIMCVVEFAHSGVMNKNAPTGQSLLPIPVQMGLSDMAKLCHIFFPLY